MINACSVALAGLFALSFYESGQAQTNKKPNLNFLLHRSPQSYTVQTVSVRASCFPSQLRDILSYIARQTGRSPIVTSGFRPHPSHRGSLHRSCMAADIRVPGVSDRAVIAAAESAPGIGGIGNYCNGIIHVDVGPKRRWHDC